MECCKLRSVGLYNGKVCLVEWGDKEGEPSSFQVLAECTELVYVRSGDFAEGYSSADGVF